MAAYLGHFYNHKGNLKDRLKAENDVTVVPLLDEAVTERILLKTAMMPDAATMAAFDTLEIELDINCTYQNPFACSEWDRIAHLQYCLNDCPNAAKSPAGLPSIGVEDGGIGLSMQAHFLAFYVREGSTVFVSRWVQGGSEKPNVWRALI